MSEMPSIKVAAVQVATIPFDGPAATQRTVALIAEAAATGAKIAVFPEAFIGGYPKGLDFGCSVGRRTAEGRADFVRYVRGAITVPAGSGPARRGLRGARHPCGGRRHRARWRNAPLHGALSRPRWPSRQASQGDADGLGAPVWGFGDGSTLTVVDTPYGKLGGAICWEHYMPPAARRLLQQGRRDLGRAHRRRPGDLDLHHAACGDGRPLLRHQRLPGDAPLGLPEDYASRIDAAPTPG